MLLVILGTEKQWETSHTFETRALEPNNKKIPKKHSFGWESLPLPSSPSPPLPSPLLPPLLSSPPLLSPPLYGGVVWVYLCTMLIQFLLTVKCCYSMQLFAL